MKVAIKSLKKYSEHIENALTYEYSNGTIEGVNIKIKVLKRVSFGNRRFDNFKKRILICNELLSIKIPLFLADYTNNLIDIALNSYSTKDLI